MATSITPNDDTRVESEVQSRPALAFTGGMSLPLTIGGALLLIAGVTIIFVGRERTRHRRV